MTKEIEIATILIMIFVVLVLVVIPSIVISNYDKWTSNKIHNENK